MLSLGWWLFAVHGWKWVELCIEEHFYWDEREAWCGSKKVRMLGVTGRRFAHVCMMSLSNWSPASLQNWKMITWARFLLGIHQLKISFQSLDLKGMHFVVQVNYTYHDWFHHYLLAFFLLKPLCRKKGKWSVAWQDNFKNQGKRIKTLSPSNIPKLKRVCIKCLMVWCVSKVY